MQIAAKGARGAPGFAKGIWPKYLCAVFLSWASPFAVDGLAEDVPAASDDIPTITVLGRRHEAERQDRPGQSLVIRPEDPTRFDTGAQLRREASLALPETGRISASGFAVPRVRGQDTRLTEVYVEDLLLQDPYSGLPLVDEIDLRAFGELAVHQGVPPPELPTVNPVGVIQYRLRPLTSDASLAAGTTAGRPYGTSAWVLGAAKGDPGEVRVYVRRHVTDGRYPYYSDNGTPYTTSDDRTLMRTNNQRQSWQAMPVFAVPLAGGTLKGLALAQTSRTGLPALNPNIPSLAESRAEEELATLRWEKSFLAFTAGGNRDRRSTDDPTQAVTGARTASELTVTGGHGGVEAVFGEKSLTARFGVDGGSASVRAAAAGTERLRVKRGTTTAYAALASSPLPPVSLEAKLLGRWLDDRVTTSGPEDQTGEVASPARRLYTPGATLAASWTWATVSLYGQLAKVKRAPSLLEEFGDGALIRGAPAISSETGLHREVGLTWRSRDARAHAGLTLFQDDTEDRIVLLPSLAQSLRAQNVGRSRIQGAELRADWDIGPVRALFGATRLYPFDLSSSDHTRILPLVAERTVTAGLEGRAGPATLRWQSRYQSQVFRDLQNQIVVPAYWLHDVSADTSLPVHGTQVQAGLAVLNATDVRRLEIHAPGAGGNDGATGYSDLGGYPLPGRQWRASVGVRF